MPLWEGMLCYTVNDNCCLLCKEPKAPCKACVPLPSCHVLLHCPGMEEFEIGPLKDVESVPHDSGLVGLVEE